MVITLQPFLYNLTVNIVIRTIDTVSLVFITFNKFAPKVFITFNKFAYVKFRHFTIYQRKMCKISHFSTIECDFP